MTGRLYCYQGVGTVIKKPPAKFGIFNFYWFEEIVFGVNNYLKVLVEKSKRNCPSLKKDIISRKEFVWCPFWEHVVSRQSLKISFFFNVSLNKFCHLALPVSKIS